MDGIVITASPFDWLFAKGCIASVHYFAPDLPVCLLIDGNVDTNSSERIYRIATLRKANVTNPWLKANSFGWGLTKMIAAWESPFERYLHLDADTVLWGSPSGVFHENTADAVWSIPGSMGDSIRSYVNTWFFDTEEIARRWPEFDWRRHASHFSCTGTFLLKRGRLKLARYQELLEANQRRPGLFKFGEMGILNFMLFEDVQAGTARIAYQDFQVIFPEHPREMLQRRFRFDDQGQPVVANGDEKVLHMPDQKPLLENPHCYSNPMTFFRLRYLEATEGVTGEHAMQRLRDEDSEYHRLRSEFLSREKRHKVTRLLKGHPGEWRRLFRKFF